MIDVSITLWWRWPILLTSGFPSRDSAELARMVSEKSAAVAAGLIAAQTETMKVAAAALAGQPMDRSATAVVAAAVKPALRTVKANAKRLRRRRRS